VIEPVLLCRESVMTIKVLLPKLEATASALLKHEGEELPQQRTGLCENCDD
jgi:hypothetical protein